MFGSLYAQYLRTFLCSFVPSNWGFLQHWTVGSLHYFSVQFFYSLTQLSESLDICFFFKWYWYIALTFNTFNLTVTDGVVTLKLAVKMFVVLVNLQVNPYQHAERCPRII